MKNFKIKPLGLIISSVILAAATQSVFAQQAQPASDTDVEEVVVTGFAQSIATAISVKRNADTVVEAISAEDIGGLPDKSIADSLSRLPGITVTRKGGQAGTIQIRGMGEGYVFSTMNGREQVSPSGARAMEYSQFPSELINSVEVYKSPKASLIEGGVAGTVELKTVNPLDMKEERKFTVGLRGTYNDQASDLYDAEPTGHRISFSYQQKLLDDTLGFSLGYAQLKEPKSQLQFEMFNYDTVATSNPPTWTSQGFKAIQDSGVSTRDGYMGAIQFNPNDELKIQADAFYSKFEVESNGRGIWVNAIHNATRSDITYFDNLVETGANISNTTSAGTFGVRTVIDNRENENKLFSGGVKLEWHRDALTVLVDASHSDASGFELNGNGVVSQFKSVPVTNSTPAGLAIDSNQQVHYQLDGLNVPSIVTNAELTNVSKQYLNQQSVYPYANEDKIDALRLDVKYELDLPVISSVELGARTSKRNHVETRALLRYGDAGISTDYPLAITEATSDVVQWKGAFSDMPDFLAVDAKTILADAYAAGKVLMHSTAVGAIDSAGNVRPRSQVIGWRWGTGAVDTNGAPDQSSAWSIQQNADIDEDVQSAYIQANINTTIADRDLTGNVGVRYVKTKQSNYSIADFGGDASLGAVNICDVDGVCKSQYGYKRVGTEYSNTLPSLNLKYQLTDIDQVRLALARVLSRAPIRQLASFDFGSIAVVSGVPTYNYGDTNSPLLKPFVADQIDLSFEHYLEETNGSITVAAYYRKIKSFIQSLSETNYDFVANGVGDKPATYVVVSNEASETGTGGLPTEKPVVNGTYRYALNNDQGGFIKGVEIAYTQTFNFLPGYWKGLGFSGSASFTDSGISIVRPANTSFDSGEIPFPGLVEQSYNFTVFYSYENFETRLSTTFQDSFVGESRTIGPTVVPVTYAAETVLDYQAKYKTDSGLDLVFSVGNLTNEPNRSYMYDEALPLRLNWFGRTYALGVNYSF